MSYFQVASEAYVCVSGAGKVILLPYLVHVAVKNQ